MRLTSQVIISSNIAKTILELEALRVDEQIIEVLVPSIAEALESEANNQIPNYKIQKIISQKETFRIDDAKVVIQKAFVASVEQTIIILAAKEFPIEVQNKLLKIIEEPPKNKHFILIAQSKSTILPTIKSRLPVSTHLTQKEQSTLNIDIKNLSLAMVYSFVQEHKRTDAKTMKRIVEQISFEAMISGSYNLDDATLTLFSNTFLALDVGSPPAFILNTLLLKLLAKKKR